MSTSHQIAFVRPGSPAALAGVEPMDIIKEINGVTKHNLLVCNLQHT